MVGQQLAQRRHIARVDRRDHRLGVGRRLHASGR
jgi:hypothetical protein